MQPPGGNSNETLDIGFRSTGDDHLNQSGPSEGLGDSEVPTLVERISDLCFRWRGRLHMDPRNRVSFIDFDVRFWSFRRRSATMLRKGGKIPSSALMSVRMVFASPLNISLSRKGPGKVRSIVEILLRCGPSRLDRGVFPKVSLTGRRSLGEIGEDGERGNEV